MEVLHSIEDVTARKDHPIAAVGVFDGVHLGHQRIIREVVDRARSNSGTSIILSFFPHPQKVIASTQAPPLLQTFDQQAEILSDLGVDIFLQLPFTRRLSLLSPKEFAETVLVKIGLREVHVGSNFRFGHRRAGDLETLRRLGESYGFKVCTAEPVFFRGVRISSTRIRKMIESGQVSLAKRFLGRPYEICGSVVTGARRGAQLGFPTANLKTDNELIPDTGVYVTRVRVAGQIFPGATNIGFRPTLHDYREPEPTIETYLLGYSGDLYGQPMELEFCYRLRPEKKFSGLDSLIQQIRKDILGVERYRIRIATFLAEEERETGGS